MYVQFYGFNKEEEYLNNVIQRFPVFPVESKLLFAHPVNGLFAVGVFLDFARFEQIGNFALRRGFLDGVFGPSVFGRRSRIGLHIGRTLHSVKVLLGGVVMVVMMTSSDGSSAAASASAAVTDNVHLFFFVSSSSCFSEKKKSFLTFCSDGVEKSFPSFLSFLFSSLSLSVLWLSGIVAGNIMALFLLSSFFSWLKLFFSCLGFCFISIELKMPEFGWWYNEGLKRGCCCIAEMVNSIINIYSITSLQSPKPLAASILSITYSDSDVIRQLCARFHSLGEKLCT